MYTEEQVRDCIIETINEMVENINASGSITKYRKPVIGFASAQDPLYAQASEIIGYDVLPPTALLEDAKTVVSFFIPFEGWAVKYARRRKEVSNGEWSLAYYELNSFIDSIMGEIVKRVSEFGIKAASEPVTENYDHVKLTGTWGHKTSAYIAGLGTFGINRIVITPMGCGGRLGTVVLNTKITPTQRPDQENCLYKKDGTCGICAKTCLTGAIRYNSFNRFTCNLHDDYIREYASALDRGCYGCSSGPCSYYDVPNAEGHYVWIGRENCQELIKK